ncbi:hypothetical protein HCJ45_06005 [Listeria sp. FSL L7-1517]|uniref:hypothetical protein n=1 Tax=Listeria immobilis TaxID=2713502 RepID=UPI00164E46A4|nr:hypothetical protein [Listeria immobilis]MBC6296662.1 hypothetical protein [Listeria immobilis]
MRGLSLMKFIGMTMVVLALVLAGCGNEETTKTETKKQPKSIEKQEKKVKIESNEGKPQHEQLITVKLPPEADYINEDTLKLYNQAKKKYNNTTQLIIDNSVTLLLGDYCFYDTTLDELECSAVIINGTNATIKDISFEVNLEIKNQNDMIFKDNGTYSFTKKDVGEVQSNEGFSTGVAFATESSEVNEEKRIKINPEDVVIHLKNIKYTIVEWATKDGENSKM